LQLHEKLLLLLLLNADQLLYSLHDGPAVAHALPHQQARQIGQNIADRVGLLRDSHCLPRCEGGQFFADVDVDDVAEGRMVLVQHLPLRLANLLRAILLRKGEELLRNGGRRWHRFPLV